MRKTIPFPKRELPPLALVKQDLSTEHISDVRGDTIRRLLAADLRTQIQPGMRVAITAGSRGMGKTIDLLSGIVEAVKSCGGEPFIIPTMGSHGGATAEGQLEVLQRLGVTQEAVGAPVRSTMQTQSLGRSATGAMAHLDDNAAKADGIIVVGGPKAHPRNKTRIASGLLKMVTIGLGKQLGAQEAHTHGLWPSVEAVPRITMANAKILCGVSVVENPFHEPVIIEVVPPAYDAFKEADERLLEVSKSYIAEIPFAMLDLLVVDEFGKNISGTGMDLNIIGPWRMNGGERKPDFRRIVVLSLTPQSLGNALGIGLADFTTQRFAEEYNADSTYINLLTATEPGAVSTRPGTLPLALSSDKEAIEVALFSALAEERPRVCRIKNTSRLDEFWVSDALLDEVEKNENLTVVQRLAPLAFNEANNLF